MKLYVQEASMWSGTNEHRGPQCIILTRTTQAFGASNNNQIRILSNYISARWMADTLFSGPPRFSPPGCYHPLYIHNLLFPLSAAFDVNQNCQNIRTTFLSICLFLFFAFLFEISQAWQLPVLTNWNHKAILSNADRHVFLSRKPSSDSSQLILWRFIDNRLPHSL